MDTTATKRSGGISGIVIDDQGTNAKIRYARILVYGPENRSPDERKKDADPLPLPPLYLETQTNADGRFETDPVPRGRWYTVIGEAFDQRSQRMELFVEDVGDRPDIIVRIDVHFLIQSHIYKEEDTSPAGTAIIAGTPVLLRVEHAGSVPPLIPEWKVEGGQVVRSQTRPGEVIVSTAGLVGSLRAKATLSEPNRPGRKGAEMDATADVPLLERASQPITGTLGVNLRRSATNRTRDQALWVAIRNRTRAISFSGSGYKDFIDLVLCKRSQPSSVKSLPKRLTQEIEELGEHVHGVGAYELLKTATETFLLLECGVAITDDLPFDMDAEEARLGEPVSLGEMQERLTNYLGSGRLPYIKRVIDTALSRDGETDRVHCQGVLASRANEPCLLELIWSYWHEEGMLVQSINAVSRRFQNVGGAGDRDPLAHLEIDPLRPLNNLLWGYIQDEWNRLTVKRRAYEYDHHYGLTLHGKAVPALRPADSRSKFLEGFHNLLYVCSVFFKEDNDTTVIADGYPLLNALKEVHLLLAQGAHNQFGDLPWTARVEMLIQEWLLARPEIRDFLQSRALVPYKETWMPQVDTMKTLQGWSDVTVTHFRDLGVYGEQILLSIRYGDWIEINDEDTAKNWARHWRAEVQSYLHAYRVATGVDVNNRTR
jgi:hypothetical protein